MFNRIVPAAAGGIAALVLTHLPIGLENLLGFGAVMVLAAIAVLEYGYRGQRLS
jgi:hypothetical protein